MLLLKRRWTFAGLLLVIGLFAALLWPMAGFAQSATAQTWTSSITYYTPDPNGGQLWIDYYYEAGALAKTYGPITLEGHKAGSLFIGNAGLPADFTGGSAVMRASVPVIATYVQFAAGGEANNYGRLMYTGFSTADAAATFYVPTLLYQKFGSTSLMSVQNVEGSNNTVTVKSYALGSASATSTKTYNLQPYSSEILQPSDLDLPVGFNGSVVVTGSSGNVVASAQETDDAGRGAYAFEGVAGGATKIYMASMLCSAFSDHQTSYYAIQNADATNTANVTVEFYNTSGTKVATMPSTAVSPGNKISVNPCNEGVPVGTSGSAIITSTGAPVIAVGKVKSDNGIATAFVGQGAGATKVAAPYIRWAADPTAEFRSYIAVMNVGTAPATNIVATYYDANGNVAGTHTIASAGSPLAEGIKANTNASAAGALDGSGNFGISPFGGAVEITSDQDIVVVVRCAKNVALGATTVFAEDYNGIPVP